MTIFDEMVADLNPQTSIEKANARHEVMQQIALSGLQRGGFFEHAAFYGGTCLRIFHGLRSMPAAPSMPPCRAAGRRCSQSIEHILAEF